jgi:hypothetical protein
MRPPMHPQRLNNYAQQIIAPEQTYSTEQYVPRPSSYSPFERQYTCLDPRWDKGLCLTTADILGAQPRKTL